MLSFCFHEQLFSINAQICHEYVKHHAFLAFTKMVFQSHFLYMHFCPPKCFTKRINDEANFGIKPIVGNIIEIEVPNRKQ